MIIVTSTTLEALRRARLVFKSSASRPTNLARFRITGAHANLDSIRCPITSGWAGTGEAVTRCHLALRTLNTRTLLVWLFLRSILFHQPPHATSSRCFDFDMAIRDC